MEFLINTRPIRLPRVALEARLMVFHVVMNDFVDNGHVAGVPHLFDVKLAISGFVFCRAEISSRVDCLIGGLGHHAPPRKAGEYYLSVTHYRPKADSLPL